MIIKKRFHLIGRDNQAGILSIINNPVVHEPVNLGSLSGLMFPRYEMVWSLLDMNNNPCALLDINIEDNILGIFRGRWAIIERSLGSMTVLNDKIMTSRDLYIYDLVEHSRTMIKEMPTGKFVLGIEGKIIDISSGLRTETNILKDHVLLDMELLSQESGNVQEREGVPKGALLSNSPIESYKIQRRDYVYVFRSKNGDYKVLIGPASGSKLRIHSSFTERYWSINGPWIARGSRIDNLLDSSRGFTISDSITCGCISLGIKDVYWSNDSVIILYESNNFEVLVSKKL